MSAIGTSRALGRLTLTASLAATLAAGLGGCTSGPEDSDADNPAPVTSAASRSTQGPLQFDGEAFGGADDPPPRRLWDGRGGAATWSTTFGMFFLCTTDPDADITIEDVSTVGSPAPRAVTGTVRTLTPQLAKAAGDAETAPVGAYPGSAPDFDEAYADGIPPLAGDVTTDLGAVEVDQRCGQPQQRFRFTEMLVTVAAEETGARVDGLRVRYTSDGRPYVLAFPFELLMCGTRVTESPGGTCQRSQR